MPGRYPVKLVYLLNNFIMKEFQKLSRAEMKNVTGGVHQGGNTACTFVTSGPNYSNPSEPGMAIMDGTGAEASANANAYCVTLISTPGNGIYHCSYSCD
jgi:hypothetical protein